MDAIDKRILQQIQENSRLSMTELGDRVGLSASACHRRIKAMEDTGLISGYVATLDASQLGQTMAFVLEVSLNSQSDDAMKAFESTVALIPEILQCDLMTGAFDYVLRINAKDSSNFERIHARVRGAPNVMKLETKMVLRNVKPWRGIRV